MMNEQKWKNASATMPLRRDKDDGSFKDYGR